MRADVLRPALGALGLQHVPPAALGHAALGHSGRWRGHLCGRQPHCSWVVGPIHYLEGCNSKV